MLALVRASARSWRTWTWDGSRVGGRWFGLFDCIDLVKSLRLAWIRSAGVAMGGLNFWGSHVTVSMILVALVLMMWMQWQRWDYRAGPGYHPSGAWGAQVFFSLMSGAWMAKKWPVLPASKMAL